MLPLIDGFVIFTALLHQIAHQIVHRAAPLLEAARSNFSKKNTRQPSSVCVLCPARPLPLCLEL
jgi:hypothetical protein